MKVLTNIILLLIITIIISFNLGFYLGKKRGKKLILNSLPLYYKELSLKKGYCISCGEKYMVKLDEEGN
jgi:uncharacterized protein YneF (UPF0154 family)